MSARPCKTKGKRADGPFAGEFWLCRRLDATNATVYCSIAECTGIAVNFVTNLRTTDTLSISYR